MSKKQPRLGPALLPEGFTDGWQTHAKNINFTLNAQLHIDEDDMYTALDHHHRSVPNDPGGQTKTTSCVLDIDGELLSLHISKRGDLFALMTTTCQEETLIVMSNEKINAAFDEALDRCLPRRSKIQNTRDRDIEF